MPPRPARSLLPEQLPWALRCTVWSLSCSCRASLYQGVVRRATWHMHIHPAAALGTWGLSSELQTLMVSSQRSASSRLSGQQPAV